MTLYGYEYCWYDAAGNLGVLMLVLSYLALQIDKLDVKGFWYSLINLLVAVLLSINLYFRPNLSSIIIEVFWALISIYGIIRYYKKSVK